mgnify:CR=1 FL=1
MLGAARVIIEKWASAQGFVHNAVVTSSTILSGGATLAVTTWGAGGVPVVALHPGVGDRRIWQQCAPSWVNAGHVVVASGNRSRSCNALRGDAMRERASAPR